MQFGGSTFSFMWAEPVLTSLERLLAVGLNDSDVMMVPGHLWFDDDPVHLLDGMRRSNVRIESLNLPSLDLNLCSVVPEVRAYAIETYLRTLDLADSLEAKGVVVVPGRVSGLLPPAARNTMDWLEDGIATLERRARTLGQTLLLESHPLTPIPRAEQIGAFVAGFSSAHVKIAYDIASAEFMSENQVDAITALGGLIGQFHLSDSPKTAWRHDAIGKGTVDVAAVLGAIEAGHPDTRVIIEIISPDPEAEFRQSLTSLGAMDAEIAGRR